MRILFSILATILLLGPFAAWTYFVALGCAYKTNSSSCSISLSDYWESEFLMLAIVPWVLGTLSLIAAIRWR